MTAKETAALEKLREELHSYHVEVKQVVVRCDERCDLFHQTVAGIKLDLDGEQPPSESHPGLKAEVAELKRSRRVILTALKGLWAALLVVLGAVVTFFLK